jgi:hypothetical protein
MEWRVQGAYRIGVFAVGAIAAGQEITMDYNWQRAPGEPMEDWIVCNCGAATCSGYLGGGTGRRETQGASRTSRTGRTETQGASRAGRNETQGASGAGRNETQGETPRQQEQQTAGGAGRSRTLLGYSARNRGGSAGEWPARERQPVSVGPGPVSSMEQELMLERGRTAVARRNRKALGWDLGEDMSVLSTAAGDRLRKELAEADEATAEIQRQYARGRAAARIKEAAEEAAAAAAAARAEGAADRDRRAKKRNLETDGKDDQD